MMKTDKGLKSFWNNLHSRILPFFEMWGEEDEVEYQGASVRTINVRVHPGDQAIDSELDLYGENFVLWGWLIAVTIDETQQLGFATAVGGNLIVSFPFAPPLYEVAPVSQRLLQSAFGEGRSSLRTLKDEGELV